MPSVNNTYIYHHYQIVIAEDPQNRFYYAVNNQYSNDTIWKPNINFAAALDAENAAQVFVDALPVNTSKPYITAVTGSDVTTDAVIEALLMNKYTIEVAKIHNEQFAPWGFEDWD